MKMRVLYSSPKGKMATFAEAIAQSQNLKSDVIPPAYSCDKERLVILGLSTGNDPADAVRLFCRELTKQRTAYVAIFTDCKPGAPGLQKLIDAVKEAGTTFIDDIKYVDGGLPFKFIKKISLEERQEIVKWAEGVMAKVE